MTEKEKMLNSQMYNPMGDKQLRNERCSVKNLCREYNNLPFEDEETQKILIKKIVGSTKGKFLHYRSVLVRLRLQYRTR